MPHDPADSYADVRAEVVKLCAGFPGSYCRALDAGRGYPTAFVEALTASGYLAALIPEDYGGAGLPLSGAPSPSWRRCSARAATAPPATPRCT